MKPVLAAAAAVTLALGAPTSIAFLAASQEAQITTALTSAAAVCVYANPDPDHIATTMRSLSNNVVRAQHWERYSHLIGQDPSPAAYQASTAAQRDELLDLAVRRILWDQAPNAVTTPPIVWWHGQAPADNDDDRWQSTSVPGYDGTLDQYLHAFVDRYGASIDNDVSCTPPGGSNCPQPVNLDAAAATIRHLESGSNYRENHRARSQGGPPGSGYPSGAYQFLEGTWGDYGGFREAWTAPNNVQDARATDDIVKILDRFGEVNWVPVAWYLGMTGAQRVQDGTTPWNSTPNPEHNSISIRGYQDKWMDYYTTIALPAVGVEPIACPQGHTAIIAWAESQLGAPYAAVNPYRFGVPFPGGTVTGFRGDTYNFPRGTVGYDCSGFVIAAYRAIGIDLAGQHGLYSSQAFVNAPLPDAPRTALLPGDIAVYRPRNGVGHIVLIHHVDTDGTVYVIEAAGGRGVVIRPIKWDRVNALKRVPIPTADTGTTWNNGDADSGE